MLAIVIISLSRSHGCSILNISSFLTPYGQGHPVNSCSKWAVSQRGNCHIQIVYFLLGTEINDFEMMAIEIHAKAFSTYGGQARGEWLKYAVDRQMWSLSWLGPPGLLPRLPIQLPAWLPSVIQLNLHKNENGKETHIWQTWFSAQGCVISVNYILGKSHLDSQNSSSSDFWELPNLLF